MNIPTNRQECEQLFSTTDKIKVVFTKKNGEQRAMLCTRSAELIPATKQAKQGNGGTSPRPPSETSFPVFDLEKADWRAFTIANLISVEVG
jgi:hypothetical protein